MLQQALQKLTAEIAAVDKKNKYVPVVGGFLINHVRNNPEHAELILTEGKTIAGSLNAMQAEASKFVVNQCGVLSDEEGFNIVLKYYGVNVPEVAPAIATQAANFDLSLDDLL